MRAIPIRPGVYRFAPRFDLLGAISGLLALVISGAQAWNDVSRTPDTVAWNANAAVELIYDPVQKLVTLQFPVLLQNNGSREDVLTNVRASLNDKATWNLQQEQISITETGDVPLGIRTPFGLRLGSLQLHLSMHSLQDNVLAVGHHRIIVNVETTRPLPALGYCFDLTDAQVSEMRQSVQILTRTITNVSCDPQGDSALGSRSS